MTTYQVAQGHDNVAGLTDVTPQPASPGLLYPREIVAADGTVYEDGAAYTRWAFEPLISAAQYSALLSQFGLTSARSAQVTVRTVTDAARTTWDTYNATIVRPADAQYRRGFWRDVVFVIKGLEATG